MSDSVFPIDIRGLTKIFDNITAIDNLSVSVTGGTITGLLGGNGAGKSTTMGILLGLLRPTQGSIELLGLDAQKYRDRVARYINFSSPYVDLPNRLTVRQNLVIYGHLYGVRRVEQRIEELTDQLHIGELLDRRHGSLSAGQRTRASLAKALINKPTLLLLDEPTASLDPDTADWVRTLLTNYRRDSGATIFMSSHNMYEVERMCDDVIVMKQGKLVARGTPSDLRGQFERATLEEVFLDIARRLKLSLFAIIRRAPDLGHCLAPSLPVPGIVAATS